MAAYVVDHMPELPVERKLHNGGLRVPLRVPLAAERQQRRVLVDRDGRIKWCRRKKRQL